MKSKKGIIITGIVLAAITAASFAVWMIPQDIPTRFVISNPEQDIDALIEQQKIVSESTSEEFNKMLNGQITSDDYVNIAEISRSQVNSFIIKILESEIPTEWNESYAAFLEHLRSYNSYLAETVVVAKKLKDNPQSNITEDIGKLEQYMARADEYLSQSNLARP
ncbi:MAG: hypothetical protein QXE84_03060 [Candidatus Nitrosotenuis sp.]